MIVNDVNNFFFEEESINYCCDHPLIHVNKGYHVCVKCGYIHSQVLDISPRRMYDKEDIKERKINEPVFYSIGYRTTVKGRQDARGNSLPSNVIKKFKRLSKIQRSFTDRLSIIFGIFFPSLKYLEKI